MRTQCESWQRAGSIASIEPLENRRLLSGDVVLEWNTVALETTRGLLPPPRQMRMLAMLHGAVFDAVNSVERDYKPYLVKVRSPRWASPEAAAAVAAHDVLVGLVPAKQAAFDAALATSLAGVRDGPAEDAGVTLGRTVAAAMLADRRDDGLDVPTPYTPGTSPTDWQPTPPAFGAALLPQFGTMEPFAMRSPDQFLSAPPPSITSDAFTTAFDEVKSLGAVDSTTRTADQREIALYWAGPSGTYQPPGQWNRIARTVATAQENSLAENARLFALLNFGIVDAGLSSWNTKFTYNFLRPVTAIRNADADGNPETDTDPTWTPLLTTPPHPSYNSAHSALSTAAAVVLADFFGDDSIAFQDTAEITPSGAAGATVTRSFDGFWEAAQEAGASRIYGGIHWQFDNEAGLRAGRQVGDLVSKHLLKPRGRGELGASSNPCDNRDRAADCRVSFFADTDEDGHRLVIR